MRCSNGHVVMTCPRLDPEPVGGIPESGISTPWLGILALAIPGHPTGLSKAWRNRMRARSVRPWIADHWRRGMRNYIDVAGDCPVGVDIASVGRWGSGPAALDRL